MSRHYRTIYIRRASYIRCVICLFATTFALLTQSSLASAQSPYQQSSSLSVVNSVADTVADTANYPPDPPREIEWSVGESTWQDIVDAFNAGRKQESELLGLQLGTINLPDADSWASMSSAERVLWLVNDERVVRGLAPMQGLESNVMAVAQEYAQYMLNQNLFGHDADGRTPHERLHANAVLGACYDFLGISENLYVYATSSTNTPPLLLERMLYKMLYENAASGWGHRHAILWSSYMENSGAPDREGFLGVGIAQGAYTLKGKYYQNSHMIVINFFDPCANWAETEPVTPTPTPTIPPTPIATPIPTSTPVPPQLARAISGRVVVNVEDGSDTLGGEDGENGLANVTLTIHREGMVDTVVQTDALGNFLSENLPPGVYTLTPSHMEYAFTPAYITVNLIAGNVNNVSFSAREEKPSGLNYSFSLHMPLILPD